MRADFVFRRGEPADSRAAFDLGIAAMRDLMERQNHPLELDADAFWLALQPYIEHLIAHAAEWWVAQDPSDGSLLGHARSIDRDGLFELTELFVRPGAQAAGIGKALIERAFPVGRGDARLIIATNDVRALARYYAADTVARFSMASLAATPKAANRGTLDVEIARATPDDTSVVAQIEKAVVGFARHDDYPWLFENREAYLYRRRGKVVGFAFFSETGAGPIATLRPEIQSQVLLHLEDRAHACGLDEVSFQVPSVNAVALRHLLDRGFKFDAPLNLFMSNRTFGKFDRFVAFGPSIVL